MSIDFLAVWCNGSIDKDCDSPGVATRECHDVRDRSPITTVTKRALQVPDRLLRTLQVSADFAGFLRALGNSDAKQSGYDVPD